MQSLDYNLCVVYTPSNLRLLLEIEAYEGHLTEDQCPIDLHIRKKRGVFRENEKFFLLSIIILFNSLF